MSAPRLDFDSLHYVSVNRPCDDGYLNFQKIKTAHLWNAREDRLRKEQIAKTVATKTKPA